MVQSGFHAIPVDFSANKFTPKVKTLDIDLGSFAGLTLSTELIRNVKPFSAHFGLPCGTCSRAREIPVSKRLKAAGAPEPAPLRNFEHLLGVPGLKGSDLLRVESANRIYKNAVLLLFECFILQIHVILENPSRSWLWAVLAKLVKEFNNTDFSNWYFSFYDVDFDACMHGGARQKSTRFKTSSSCLQHLALACDGQHEHKQWTISLGLSCSLQLAGLNCSRSRVSYFTLSKSCEGFCRNCPTTLFAPYGKIVEASDIAAFIQTDEAPQTTHF